jgi:SAM-dependent MidA family methyltransferase
MSGVVIANEVLDAMPVSRFAIEEAGVAEIVVGWSEAGFVEQTMPVRSPGLAGAVARLQDAGLACAPGYRSEINLRAAPWIAALAECLETGLALVIDYGYPRGEYYLPERSMGTLICHYRHRAHTDPYRLVGLQDITASVDFSALADAAVTAGMGIAGFTTQSNFLLGLGIEQLLAASDPTDVESHLALVQGAKRLLLPSQMGERFQVLGLVRDLDPDLSGFSLRDLRGRL